jgi:hypothetical protein
MRPFLSILTASVILVSASAAISENQVEWKELKGRHFIVSYTDNRDFASRVLRQAEKYYKSILEQLGFRRADKFWLWERRVRINLYGSREAFSKATGSPVWAVAKANMRNRTISLAGGSLELLRSRLAHEMAHMIYREEIGFEGDVPLWLDEGVAQWCELGARHEAPPKLERMLPLHEMMRMDVRKQEDKQLVLLFYSQSASIVRYLVEEHGKEKFSEFGRHLRDGKDIEEALRFTYPHVITSIKQLEQRWMDWQSAGNAHTSGKEHQ